AGPLSRCSDFAGVASSNSVAGPPHAMGEARRPFFDAQVISLENCGGTCAAFVAAMRPARLIVFTMAFLWSASAYADADREPTLGFDRTGARAGIAGVF